jgi:Domain of unknown function (DUF397)
MPLGHQRQQIPFPRGQDPEGVLPALPGQQLGNDLGVQHGPAARDPVQGVQELLDSGDPVLQQVADRAGPVREQVAGVVTHSVRVSPLCLLRRHRTGDRLADMSTPDRDTTSRVQVRVITDTSAVPVKAGETKLYVMSDSANPDAGRLYFTEGEWDAFVAGVTDGEFDLDEAGDLPDLT